MTQHPFGPYFDVHPLDLVGGVGVGPGWLSFAEFISPASLDDLVDATHTRLVARGPLGRSRSDLRAVASTVVLGLFSRALSPAVGAEVVGALPGSGPVLGYVADPATLAWRPASAVEGGPGDLGSTTRPVNGAVSSPEEVMEQVLVPLGEAFAARFGVPEQVLRGNMAAAALGTHDVVRASAPQWGGRSAATVNRLLSHPLLQDTLARTPQGGLARTSCCLIHRLPVGFVCGTCPLVASDTPTARRLQGRA